MVLPSAIFRNCLKYLFGILGAVYRNVGTADKTSQNQCCDSRKKKMAEPIAPMKNSMMCIYWFFFCHTDREESGAESELRYQWKL